jgi:ankyrin repeat protein
MRLNTIHYLLLFIFIGCSQNPEPTSYDYFAGAILRNDIRLVEKYINEQHIDINMQDKFGETFLLLSTLYNHKKIVEILLEKGANVNIRNKEGLSPLYNAINNQDISLVNRLISMGATIDIEKGKLFSPLSLAVKKEMLEIVKLLVVNGGDVNTTNDAGETILITALHCKHYDIINFLINQKNIDLNAKDKKGNTIYYYSKDPDVAELFRLKGLKCDKNVLPSSYKKSEIMIHIFPNEIYVGNKMVSRETFISEIKRIHDEEVNDCKLTIEVVHGSNKTIMEKLQFVLEELKKYGIKNIEIIQL